MNRAATIKIVPVLALLAAAGCQLQVLPSGILRQRIPLRHPENPHALFMEGKTLLAQGEPRKAANRFRAALRHQPNFEEARLGLAYAYLEAESYRRAHKTFRQVLEQSPRNVQALEGLAKTLVQLGQTDKARASLERVLAIDPQSVSALNALAEVHYGRREYDKALERWDRSLALDPSQRQVETLRNDLKRYVEKYGPSPGKN